MLHIVQPGNSNLLTMFGDTSAASMKPNSTVAVVAIRRFVVMAWQAAVLKPSTYKLSASPQYELRKSAPSMIATCY